MKGWRESFFYVSVGSGMALATSAFTMVSGLFQVTTAVGALLGIAVAGFFCVIIALSVGELAAMYPSAPAVRTYLRAAFGDRPSLLLVYLYLIAVVLIAGLESFIFSEVFHAAFPAAAAVPTILIMLGAVAAANLAGLELPRNVQMVTTVFAVGLIVMAGAVGLWSPHRPLAADFTLEALPTVPAAAGMAVFLYMGFEWVTPVGLRPKSYQRRVPLAMVISVLVLIVTYGTFVAGAATQLTRADIAGSPVPQVGYFSALFGPAGVYLALALALAATISTFNAGIMGGSRLIYMLSREGNLPRWCAWMSARTGAPVGAVLLLGSLALVSAIGVYTWRAELLVAVIGAAIVCVLYSAFLVAVPVLRARRPGAARPFRTRVWPPLQWAGAIALPVLGLQTLLSEPSLGFGPLYGGGLALLVATALTWTFGTKSRASGRDQAPAPVTRQPL